MSVKPLSLDEAATHLLNEGRMVLPGIQALFGFQLILTFSQAFAEHLNGREQELHLASTTLVAIAVGLVMAPAALHRQLEPRAVSEGFILVSSRLLRWSMLPLAVGISADFYLIARLILDSAVAAASIAGGLLLIYLWLWFGLPRSRVIRGLAQGT